LFVDVMEPSLEDSWDVEMRSLHSRQSVEVVFFNATPSTAVRLLWLDFSGERVDYGVLGPGDRIEMDTFVTHPWVLERVEQDGEEDQGEEVFFKYVGDQPTYGGPREVRLRPVFEAQKYSSTLAALWHRHGIADEYVTLNVTIRSLYSPCSLLRAAATAVARMPGVNPDSLALLELPDTLKEEVRSLINGDENTSDNIPYWTVEGPTGQMIW
jgi:hypothetical protein